MKTQDIGYILQKAQSEKKVNDSVTVLHSVSGYLTFSKCFLITIILNVMAAAENRKANCHIALAGWPTLEQAYLLR